MPTPHEVLVFTVEEVLLDIYEGSLDSVDTDIATKAFYDWLGQHNAHYYSSDRGTGPGSVLEAVLETIKKGKHIVVIASMPALPENE